MVRIKFSVLPPNLCFADNLSNVNIFEWVEIVKNPRCYVALGCPRSAEWPGIKIILKKATVESTRGIKRNDLIIGPLTRARILSPLLVLESILIR